MSNDSVRDLTRVLFLAPFPAAGRFAGGITTIGAGLKRRVELAARLGCELSFFNTEPGRREASGAGQLRLENLRNARELISSLRRRLEAEDVDVVVVSSSMRLALMKDLVAIRAVAPKFKGRIALHVHHAGTSGILFRNSVLRAMQLGLIRRHVDDLVLLSRTTRDEFLSLGVPADRMHVLYNFQDLPIERVHTLRKVAVMAEKKTLDVLFMGSLSRQKGIVDLLSAVSAVNDSRLRLHVCGTPNEEGIEEAMSALVERLRPSIALHGYVTGEAKTDILASADVLVLPSYAEGLPMVILEAMAAGCAVVSTPVGAIPEVIEHGRNGVLLKPGDREGLAKTLRSFLDDRVSLARIAATNAECAAQYTLDRFVAEFCQIFRR